MVQGVVSRDDGDCSSYDDQRIHDIYLPKIYYIIVTSIATISDRKRKETLLLIFMKADWTFLRLLNNYTIKRLIFIAM